MTQSETSRDYSLRDACCGRIWRSVQGAIGREAMLVGFVTGAMGLYSGADLAYWCGTALAVSGALFGFAGTLFVAARRADLVRLGPSLAGTIEHARHVFLLSELFRARKDRTVILRYGYTTPDGERRSGQLWICGCVEDRFEPGSLEEVVYDPENPSRSLLLRAATMVAPL